MTSEADSQNNAAHSDPWFEELKTRREYGEFTQKPVAYFCAEYALLPFLNTYAGGLGVLAGDYIREIAAKQFPLLAVGLYYREAQNSLAPIGAPELFNPQEKLKLVLDSQGKRVLVTLPIRDRTVSAQAWFWGESGAKVYLLDTDIDENQAEDRKISHKLYTDDREIRLKQEMLLGIGGFRLLQGLGYHCSVYHMNEGHSAFLALELVRHEMKHQRVDFRTATEFARKHLVFTNHTLVAAGQEQFSSESVTQAFSGYAAEMRVPVADIVRLGTVYGSSLFSMTTFSFRLASMSSAVSKLHASKALLVWPTYPMTPVTNGIYLAHWDKISDVNNFWQKHQENKKELLKFIKDKTGQAWSEDVLLFGWGRRLVPYKRPLAFLEPLEKFIELAKNSQKPFRIVFSSPTDNANESSNPLLVELKKMLEEKLKDVAVFLPNYNMDTAKLMTTGCDVWLNTPVVGSEACGTSSMKAMLNGGLSLSTRDGWVAEEDFSDIGWVVDEPLVGEKMMELAAKEIIPEYYAHLANPKDSKWLKRMQKGRDLIVNKFSTSRMLKEYIEKFYIPTLAQKHDHIYK
jgi:glucan phosphorylase